MRATIKIEYVTDVLTTNWYGIGAEINVGRELIKVASLYLPAKSANQAVYQAIVLLLVEMPDEVTSILFRSSCQQFIKKTRLETRFAPIANDHGVKLYVQNYRKHIPAVLLATHAIERKANVISITN
ncbi:hypothetical protein LC085_07680 [Bacillus tianshenii]|uniref:hypothetical protein n=1 Tax=Sutcliffiella tianshenii TaxID=1463404 RepID=UPI001CD4D56B|nr:hypothetical protein [Bacillus tianshenii]MCA1319792.1 hypothetical protein [Bacillus tianshenii]